MKILIMEIELRASWVHSLKEKRTIVKSIIQRLKNKFNISIGEIGNQDNHKSIIIGLSFVCVNRNIAYNVKEKVLDFLEENFETEIINVKEEIIE